MVHGCMVARVDSVGSSGEQASDEGGHRPLDPVSVGHVDTVETENSSCVKYRPEEIFARPVGNKYVFKFVRGHSFEKIGLRITYEEVDDSEVVARAHLGVVDVPRASDSRRIKNSNSFHEASASPPTEVTFIVRSCTDAVVRK